MKLKICSRCCLIMALVPWISMDCKRILLPDHYDTNGFLGKRDPYSMLFLKFRGKVVNPESTSKTDALNEKNSPAFAKHLDRSRRLLSMLIKNQVINNLTSIEKTVEDVKIYLASLNRTDQFSDPLGPRDTGGLRLCNACFGADIGSASSMLTTFLTKLVSSPTTQQFALTFLASIVEAFMGQVFDELFNKAKEKKLKHPASDKDTGHRFYYY